MATPKGPHGRITKTGTSAKPRTMGNPGRGLASPTLPNINNIGAGASIPYNQPPLGFTIWPQAAVTSWPPQPPPRSPFAPLRMSAAELMNAAAAKRTRDAAAPKPPPSAPSRQRGMKRKVK